MRISVVTTFYQGGKYIDNYIKMMVENAKVLSKTDSLTVVMVNDSPWEPIDEEDIFSRAKAYIESYGIRDLVSGKFQIRVINNSDNLGIHESRVKGLLSEPCDYVMFLDQDDKICSDAIAEYMAVAKGQPEVLVANANLEQADGCLTLYRTNYHKKRVSRLKTYLSIGTMIVSPGHTMIYAKAIPEAWKINLCKKNGSDDYFLWLLMLEQEVPFRVLDEVLYTHCYTNDNLSADTSVTDQSNYEFIDHMKQNSLMKENNIKRLETMISYKAAFRQATKFKKILLSIRHLDILIPNIVFKILSKTPYGFNRG